jgi:hypothetical protein
VFTVAATLPAAMASSPAGASLAPVMAYGDDFPDPHVLVVGGVYYAYSTNVAGVNVPMMTSTNLSLWTKTTEALPSLPGWASPDHTWAPTVLARGNGYVLYYTVRDTVSDRQCVSVATAASPAGPFTDASSGPLVWSARPGRVDRPAGLHRPARLVVPPVEERRQRLRQADGPVGPPSANGGAGFAWWSSPVRLLTQTAAWQAPALEGPTMIKSGKTYFLFYGANDWNSARSAIGYATCSGPLGPCVDRSTTGPWFATNAGGSGPVGPQGPTLFTDVNSKLRLGFAAWNGAIGYPGGVRALWTARLSFVNGKPVLN